MNQQQIEIIDKEIERLYNRLIEIKSSFNYNSILKEELNTYLDGRIVGLEWVKENVE